MAAPSSRWRATARRVATGAESVDLYVPADAGDVLNVRQLRVGASAGAEVVVYFASSTTTPASAAAIPDDDRVFGHTFGANGGASPDLGCLGCWSMKPGQRLRLYIGAAATVNVAVEGTVE